MTNEITVVSEKVQNLQNKRIETKKLAMAAEFDSDEQNSLFIEVAKIEREIFNEIAIEKSAKLAAENLEARNARKQLLTDCLDNYAEVLKTIGDKKLSLEEKNVINDKFVKSREIVENELLARFGTSSSAKKPANDGTATSGTRGKTGLEIREIAEKMFADGKTGSEIRAHIIKDLGYNDGTANGVILAIEKNLGIK